MAEAQKRYRVTPKGRVVGRRYDESEKGKQRRDRYNSTEGAIAKKREWHFLNR